MNNDDDTPPLALSNEAAQPVRDPQPESSVDDALGDAFTSQGRSNTIRFVGEFESAFATYLATRGLVTIGDFQEAEAISTIRGIEGTTPSLEDGWRQATNFKVVNSATNFINDDVSKTVGG